MGKLYKFFENILRKLITSILRIFGIELTDEKWLGISRFIKFCLVGVSNTIISLGVYYIFILISRDLYIIGNAVGFVVSVFNSYILNSKFVFKKTTERKKTLIKTYIAYGTNLIIGTLLLYLFVDILGISEVIAPLINLCITVPLNYILNKKWVMR